MERYIPSTDGGIMPTTVIYYPGAYPPQPPPRRHKKKSGGILGAVAFITVAVVVLTVVFGSHGKANAPHHTQPTAPSVAGSGNWGPKLLAAAETHDNEGYQWGGGHPPGSYTKGSGLDCSGLVDIAVLDVAGIDQNETAGDFQFDHKYWAAIPMQDARAGDIMYRLVAKHPGDFTDHVVFVVNNKGDGKLTVFEAWTSGTDFADQIRLTYNQSYSRFDGALRFHKLCRPRELRAARSGGSLLF